MSLLLSSEITNDKYLFLAKMVESMSATCFLQADGLTEVKFDSQWT